MSALAPFSCVMLRALSSRSPDQMMRRVFATHLRGLAERSGRAGSRWASTQAVPIDTSHEEPPSTFRSARVMPGAKAELRNVSCGLSDRI